MIIKEVISCLIFKKRFLLDSQYQILVQKLDDFIRKYYRNQIIRGSIITVLIFLSAWFSTSVLEYYGHFSIVTRTIIFYFSFALLLYFLGRMIIYPVLQFYKIGKIINHEQASSIISRHFVDLQDKLINTLELERLKSSPAGFSQDLIIASIDDRISQIKPIQFPKAINVRTNYKYLRYLTVLSVVMVIILISSPSILTEGAERIVKHRTYFQKESPFEFILLNKNMKAQKGEDFTVLLKMDGQVVPENVSISYGGSEFLMKKKSNTEYEYNFRNINNSINFYFTAQEINSDKFHLEVLPTPVITGFEIYVDVPGYTGEKDRIIKNNGDVTIPCGSKLKWVFHTMDTDNLTVTFNDSVSVRAKTDSSGLSLFKTFYENTVYSLNTKNQYFEKNNVVKYSVNVIPDLHPGIKVNSFKDSTEQTVYFFQGLITDDYGFRNLTFNYYLNEKKDSVTGIKIPYDPSVVSQEFYYAFDFSQLNSKQGSSINYYFEVWDNDEIHGSKSSRSIIFEYNIPSEEELEKFETESNKNIEDKLRESMKMVDEIKKNLNEMKENMINREMTSWEKTKMIENISQKQNSLEKLMQDINNINQQKNDLMNSVSEQEQELIEKQKEIEEMLENLMDDELKKMMEELQKLMENFDKTQFNKLSEKMESNYEDLAKQLDRNLELLKKFEVEKNIEKTIDKLNELAKQQEQLSEDVKEKNADLDQLSEKQSEQKEEFEKAMQEYKETLEKNKELQNPMNLSEFQNDKENISNEFQNGSDEIQKGNKNKASGSQKKNSDQLKNLSASMQGMMQQNQTEQNSENIDDLKQILENLVTFSFNQEELMENLKKINRIDPKYFEYTNNQNRLKDNFIIIDDSLTSLAKRSPMLSSAITKELLSINQNLETVVEIMADNMNTNLNTASIKQQQIMTSANNLALLLAEVLDQMQQQQMNQCSGSKSCSKPGKGKPSMSDMKNQQQSLKQQLESMIQQMKEAGNKPDKNSMNKQLAKMLAEQEIFNNQLGKLMNSGGIQPEAMKLLKEIQKLVEQNENDIINKNVTPATLKRQELILTRLLEAENSEYQREIDNKRKSNEAKNEKISNPKDFFQYKRLHSKYNELLNTSDIKMYKYYNEKYKQYLINLNEE